MLTGAFLPTPAPASEAATFCESPPASVSRSNTRYMEAARLIRRGGTSLLSPSPTLPESTMRFARGQ